MGMDVCGRRPTGKAGRYFRNNVWWWRPLADYVQEVDPETAARCRHWQSNDGDGLDASDSVTLADALQRAIDNGETAQYAAGYERNRKALPRVQCDLCDGTGIRRDAVGESMGMPDRVVEMEGNPRNGERGWCNGCDGHGTRSHWDSHYPFSVKNVQKFVTFVRHSGGFCIF